MTENKKVYYILNLINKALEKDGHFNSKFSDINIDKLNLTDLNRIFKSLKSENYIDGLIFDDGVGSIVRVDDIVLTSKGMQYFEKLTKQIKNQSINNRLNIFIIMPISATSEKHTKKYWKEFYVRIQKIIKNNAEVIKQFFNVDELKIWRAETPHGNIVKDILLNLKNSDIVIAVLTDLNPNVFYELGVRHTLQNKTILLCQESSNIPFDLKNYGVGIYKENKRYTDIENYIFKVFKQIVINPNLIDSPVLEFLFKEHNDIKKIEIKKNNSFFEEYSFNYSELMEKNKLNRFVEFSIIIENRLFEKKDIAYIYSEYLPCFLTKGTNYLPHILNQKFKTKNQPDILFENMESYYQFKNWKLFDKLAFNKQFIIYKSIELMDKESNNFTSYFPFLALGCLLLFLFKYQIKRKSGIKLNIKVRLKSNFKPINYKLVDSEVPTELFDFEGHPFSNYMIKDNQAHRNIEIDNLNIRSFCTLYQSIINLFISSNEKTMNPYLSIDFNNFKKVFEKLMINSNFKE